MSLEQLMVDQIMEQAKTRIDFIHEKLIETAERAKFPVDLFTEHFAPYFFGDKQVPRDADIFGTWVGIAGSPMASVDVVDKSGKVEFTVPPLFDTNILDLHGKGGLSRVIENYNNYSNSLPAMAMGYVKNNLLPAAEEAVGNPTHSEALVGWAKIAQYYKRTESSQVQSTSQEGIANNNDDDLSYE